MSDEYEVFLVDAKGDVVTTLSHGGEIDERESNQPPTLYYIAVINELTGAESAVTYDNGNKAITYVKKHADQLCEAVCGEIPELHYAEVREVGAGWSA